MHQNDLAAQQDVAITADTLTDQTADLATDLPAIFERRDPAWRRVSNKYALVDLALNLLLALLLGVVQVVVLAANQHLLTTIKNDPGALMLFVPGALAVATLINAFFAFRRVRAIGYILLQDELVFRRGIMFERIVSVPYGRLQLVDITRGPMLRALGLATLKFVTASAATGVHLPGLPLAEAEELRDRLMQLAETRRSGL